MALIVYTCPSCSTNFVMTDEGRNAAITCPHCDGQLHPYKCTGGPPPLIVPDDLDRFIELGANAELAAERRGEPVWAPGNLLLGEFMLERKIGQGGMGDVF